MPRRKAEMDSRDTGIKVGLLVASALVPETFAPSLSTRTVVDQGVVTGLSTSLQYLLTLAAQDSLHAVAAELASALSGPETAENDRDRRVHNLTLLADLAAIPLGLGLGRALPSRPGQAMLRGSLRQLGWRYAVTGVGGLLVAGTEHLARRLDDRLGSSRGLSSLALVPAGVGAAAVLARRAPHGVDPDWWSELVRSPARLQSLGLASGVVSALTAAAYAEHELASVLGRRLAGQIPGSAQLWKLAGHGLCFALLGLASSSFWQRSVRRIETGTVTDEPVLGDDQEAWTGPTVSGGSGSAVPWSTLGREGRRHVIALVRPSTVPDLPAGLPDLSIETVMKQPARAVPVEVYIGLDSAGGARERVDLALAELERTGAFERSLLMLVSPTGTGYVNYVAVAAAQYLTRGDVATVTMQYSKRPSPLSLGLVGAAREQNRLLWLQILARLRERSGPRPRVVLFGESLGAHTSQDVFLHWGTLGLRTLGIDRALWIGTPYGSGWRHQLNDPTRLDVDRDCVAIVNDFGQLEALDRQRRDALRYVLLSHDNDGVTKFGLDLLTTAPHWLGAERPRLEQLDGASPRGIPSAMRWRPITTFFQALVDMKNAQLPGAYRAWAHDYRADLPRFVSEVFDLPASPEQMQDIESALREREKVREQLFAHRPVTIADA